MNNEEARERAIAELEAQVKEAAALVAKHVADENWEALQESSEALFDLNNYLMDV